MAPRSCSLHSRTSRARHARTRPAATAPGISLFPSGAKQASVVLPAIMLHVQADQLMSESGADKLEQLNRAVKAGATAVVLSEGSSGAGASALYEAAVKLKALLTGRAALLVVDRLDIAQAVEADGVLLTDTGVPTVVAKRMLATTGGGLVGRITADAAAAVTAAADGANLVLVTAPDQGPPDAATLTEARTRQRSGNAIPVLLAAVSFSAPDFSKRLAAAWAPDKQLDGVALDAALVPSAAAAVAGSSHSANGQMALDAAVALVSVQLKQQAQAPVSPRQPGTSAAQAPAQQPAPAPAEALAPVVSDAPVAATADAPAAAAPATQPAPAPAPAAPAKKRAGRKAPPGDRGWARRLLQGSDSEALLVSEKQTLTCILAFLEEVVPDLPELALLRDAVKQLDEPFLVVVVGEFNSGKSSVINALLGKKFLAEGILPTTNEISVLRFSDAPGAEQRVERQADGLYVRYLPARLLEEMQIVDTPGTNVILERQQRLTEEYVPRADLVLFVMSADRPFSESEVRFLEYIRQWRKKVVFVVNKADMLESQDEVDQVKSFVADNARRVLRLDEPPVIAVSSRAAMKAKKAAAWQPTDSAVVEYDEGVLANSKDWRISGFGTFERIIYAFLIGQEGPAGSVEGAGEGVRLKLQTPLYVADALVGAVGKKLAAEIKAAQAELSAVRAIGGQLGRFRADMEKDATAQRDALLKVLSAATGRMDSYIDRTLALSNVVALVDYLTGPKTAAAMATSLAKFEAEAVGGAFDRVRDAVVEHAGWLDANCDAQLSYYRGFVSQRVEEARGQGRSMQDVEAAVAALPTSSALASSAAAATAAGSGNSLAGAAAADSLALAANAGEFDLMAATTLLEEELREAVVGTASTAIGAPTLGLLITSWIDNAFEDLLVLGVAGAAAYASVLNLPLRRAEIKRKVAKLAADFVEGVQGRMKAQLDAQLTATLDKIEQLVVPLEAAAAAEVERVEALEQQRVQLAAELQALSQRAANL